MEAFRQASPELPIPTCNTALVRQVKAIDGFLGVPTDRGWWPRPDRSQVGAVDDFRRMSFPQSNGQLGKALFVKLAPGKVVHRTIAPSLRRTWCSRPNNRGAAVFAQKPPAAIFGENDDAGQSEPVRASGQPALAKPEGTDEADVVNAGVDRASTAPKG